MALTLKEQQRQAVRLCEDTGRHLPCYLTECRYHLLNGRQRRALETRPRIAELKETCALRVAEEGAHTLDEVGALLGVTRERVRQLEELALLKLRSIASYSTALREFF